MGRKATKDTWDWVPNVRLGPVELGAEIGQCVAALGFRAEDPAPDAITGWTRYTLPDSSTAIFEENGKVVSVSTADKLIFRNRNVIGLEVARLNDLLQRSDGTQRRVPFESGAFETCHDYDDLGLHVWSRDGIVVSVDCQRHDTDQD